MADGILLISTPNVLKEVKSYEIEGAERLMMMHQGRSIGENVRLAQLFLHSRFGLKDAEHVAYMMADLIKVTGAVLDDFLDFSQPYIKFYQDAPMIFALMSKETLTGFKRNYAHVLDDYFNYFPKEWEKMSKRLGRKIFMPMGVRGVHIPTPREIKEDGIFFANGHANFGAINVMYGRRKMNLSNNRIMVIPDAIKLMGINNARYFIKEALHIKLGKPWYQPIPLSLGNEAAYELFGHEFVFLDNPFKEFGMDADTGPDLKNLGFHLINP
jgi:hypothetical protein